MNLIHFSGLHAYDASGRELRAWMEGFAGMPGQGSGSSSTTAMRPTRLRLTLWDESAWTIEGNQARAYLGASVATAGDVNKDGYSDVIVGVYLLTTGRMDEGRAFVFLGSLSGLSATPAWTAESGRTLTYFGWSVATAGDVNGDGYSDVIVGANFYDQRQGRKGAPMSTWDRLGALTSPSMDGRKHQPSAMFGSSVATAGDVNGDGYSDVIIGAESFANGQTQGGTSLCLPGLGLGPCPSAAWTAESDQVNARFGGSVATAGDVNGDGYSDVIVGADSTTTAKRTRAAPTSTSARPRACLLRPPGPPSATNTANSASRSLPRGMSTGTATRT